MVVATDQSPALFLDWQREATSFSAMCALTRRGDGVKGSDKPERITGAIVTAGFFDVVRRRPTLGRPLTPADDSTAPAWW